MGASSACWTQFAEVNASLPRVGAGPLRRLVTDAYMVQHPGVPERRAIQSVGLHLVALCLVLEHGFPVDRLSETVALVLARPPAWRWLEPPVPNGISTIGEVWAAAGRGEAAAAIETSVRGVWTSWASWHGVVERWVGEAGLG